MSTKFVDTKARFLKDLKSFFENNEKNLAAAARKLGIPRTTLISYMGGTVTPGAGFFIGFANEYGFTELYHLLTGEYPDTMDATPERQKLVELYEKAKNINPRAVEGVMETLEGLADENK